MIVFKKLTCGLVFKKSMNRCCTSICTSLKLNPRFLFEKRCFSFYSASDFSFQVTCDISVPRWFASRFFLLKNENSMSYIFSDDKPALANSTSSPTDANEEQTEKAEKKPDVKPAQTQFVMDADGNIVLNEESLVIRREYTDADYIDIKQDVSLLHLTCFENKALTGSSPVFGVFLVFSSRAAEHTLLDSE